MHHDFQMCSKSQLLNDAPIFDSTIPSTLGSTRTSRAIAACRPWLLVIIEDQNTDLGPYSI